MSCCVIPKAKKSSSIKQLDQLRDYFDFVELEDLEKYRVLTLKIKLKKEIPLLSMKCGCRLKLPMQVGCIAVDMRNC